MNLVVEAASLVIMLVGIALGLGLLAWLARELLACPRHR